MSAGFNVVGAAMDSVVPFSIRSRVGLDFANENSCEYNYFSTAAAIVSLPFAVKSGANLFSGVGNLFRSSDDAVDLFRAVSPAELDDIVKNNGAFRNPVFPSKYFSFTAEGASSYAQQTFGTGLYQGPYTIVQTRFPRSLIDPLDLANVDRGIESVVVSTNNLQFLDRAKILNSTRWKPLLR